MNTSYHIIELVKRRMSNQFLSASDTDAAKVLNLSRAAVSAYKHGRDVMSLDTLARAQEILKLSDGELMDYSLALSIEASPQMKRTHAAERFLQKHAKRLPAAAILIALMLGVGAVIPEPAQAHTAAAAVTAPVADLYIMRSIGAIVYVTNPVTSHTLQPDRPVTKSPLT